MIHLLYPGRVNGIVGHSGSGKSLIAQLAVVQAITANSHVVWVDYEDTPQGLHSRLTDLGAKPEDIERYVHYVQPEANLGDVSKLKWRQRLENSKPSLVVIDSVGEALAANGYGPNNDEEVALWFREQRKFWADEFGAAVLMIDHLVKDESKIQFAAGSHRKRAAITGASYRVDTKEEFAKGQQGWAAIVVMKDRWVITGGERR